MESVVTCQVTPDGKLVDQLRKAIDTTMKGNRRLIQEDVGQPVTLCFKATNPFKLLGYSYGDEDSLVKTGDECGAMGAFYCIV